VKTPARDPAPPEVQVLGTHVVLGGATLLDVSRLLRLGLQVVQSRDGINAPARVQQAVVAFEVAVDRSQRLRRGSDAPDMADVRGRATSEGSGSPLVGSSEVAELSGLSIRQAQRLIVTLGGTRNHAGHLRIDRRVLEQHLAEQEEVSR
jgi:hypothetical protein